MHKLERTEAVHCDNKRKKLVSKCRKHVQMTKRRNSSAETIVSIHFSELSVRLEVRQETDPCSLLAKYSTPLSSKKKHFS